MRKDIEAILFGVSSSEIEQKYLKKLSATYRAAERMTQSDLAPEERQRMEIQISSALSDLGDIRSKVRFTHGLDLPDPFGEPGTHQ